MRADRLRLFLEICLAVVGLAAVSGLGLTNYKMWKAERHLGSAVGELREELDETRKAQAGIAAGLADLNSSYTSLRSEVAAMGLRLAIGHSPTDIDITSLDDYEALSHQGQSFRDSSAREQRLCTMTQKPPSS